ncbi:phospholipase D-like domain-containing protein [Streptosporangium sp. NPDC006013]|uniref:phospholipase D-like domain-containing protein n=1 Tax=Streptosporangium sp. NPDC006013 TaxID=3155596 RepID=UPI00339E467E
MARILEPLRPLVALYHQAQKSVDIAAAATNFAAAAGTGDGIVELIGSAVTDRRLVSPVLIHAGVLDQKGQVTHTAPLLLAQAHAMTVMAVEESWDLVLTVPAFFKTTLGLMTRDHGGPGLPLDTGTTIRAVAEQARSRLVIAAPYLHASFIEVLAPYVKALLKSGGSTLVITRGLACASPSRSDFNIDAVAVLRKAAGTASERLSVRSWDESGLGIHFKVVMADSNIAYIGSANLTPGGTSAHAEAGVLLRGTKVSDLARWLEAVAQQLTPR